MSCQPQHVAELIPVVEAEAMAGAYAGTATRPAPQPAGLRTPPNWSALALKGLKGEQLSYAQQYAAWLARQRPTAPECGLPWGAGRQLRDKLRTAVKRTAAPHCADCGRFMGAQGCADCPGPADETPPWKKTPEAAAVPVGTSIATPTTTPAIPSGFNTDAAFARWLTDDSPQVFGDPAQWDTLENAGTDSVYMAVCFDEPQDPADVEAHLRYIVQDGPLQTRDFDPLDIGAPQVGVVGAEADGQARMFFYYCDWASSKRTAGFQEEAEKVLKRYLEEGTPVRATSRAGAAGTRKHVGKGGVHIAFANQELVDNATAEAYTQAPALKNLVPAREAYNAALGQLHKYIPRCSGCGRFLATQDPTCHNPKCGAKEIQQFNPVPWPPPGYTFKHSRVFDAPASGAPVMSAETETLTPAPVIEALGAATTNEGASAGTAVPIGTEFPAVTPKTQRAASGGRRTKQAPDDVARRSAPVADAAAYVRSADTTTGYHAWNDATGTFEPARNAAAVQFTGIPAGLGDFFLCESDKHGWQVVDAQSGMAIRSTVKRHPDKQAALNEAQQLLRQTDADTMNALRDAALQITGTASPQYQLRYQCGTCGYAYQSTQFVNGEPVQCPQCGAHKPKDGAVTGAPTMGAPVTAPAASVPVVRPEPVSTDGKPPVFVEAFDEWTKGHDYASVMRALWREYGNNANARRRLVSNLTEKRKPEASLMDVARAYDRHAAALARRPYIEEIKSPDLAMADWHVGDELVFANDAGYGTGKVLSTGNRTLQVVDEHGATTWIFPHQGINLTPAPSAPEVEPVSAAPTTPAASSDAVATASAPVATPPAEAAPAPKPRTPNALPPPNAAFDAQVTQAYGVARADRAPYYARLTDANGQERYYAIEPNGRAIKDVRRVEIPTVPEQEFFAYLQRKDLGALGWQTKWVVCNALTGKPLGEAPAFEAARAKAEQRIAALGGANAYRAGVKTAIAKKKLAPRYARTDAYTEATPSGGDDNDADRLQAMLVALQAEAAQLDAALAQAAQ